MAIMEVNFPSGFTADTDSIPSLLATNKNVKKVETKNGDTQIVLYFDHVSSYLYLFPARFLLLIHLMHLSSWHEI